MQGPNVAHVILNLVYILSICIEFQIVFSHIYFLQSQSKSTLGIYLHYTILFSVKPQGNFHQPRLHTWGKKNLSIGEKRKKSGRFEKLSSCFQLCLQHFSTVYSQHCRQIALNSTFFFKVSFEKILHNINPYLTNPYHLRTHCICYQTTSPIFTFSAQGKVKATGDTRQNT